MTQKEQIQELDKKIGHIETILFGHDGSNGMNGDLKEIKRKQTDMMIWVRGIALAVPFLQWIINHFL